MALTAENRENQRPYRCLVSQPTLEMQQMLRVSSYHEEWSSMNILPTGNMTVEGIRSRNPI